MGSCQGSWFPAGVFLERLVDTVQGYRKGHRHCKGCHNVYREERHLEKVRSVLDIHSIRLTP